MVSRLSQLTDLIKQDFLPLWLKEQIDHRKDEMLRELNERGEGIFTFKGPAGEEIRLEIKAEEDAGVAA
jgi:hypothetical protein